MSINEGLISGFEIRSRKMFEQEQTELTESFLKISVSSVASCEEVTNVGFYSGCAFRPD